jgi:hypothetical protein
VTGNCTASYNHRAVGYKSCENTFFLTSTILGGRDVIEEFVAVEVWPISHGWASTEIVFNVNWATQQVPFPRFGLPLKEGQTF